MCLLNFRSSLPTFLKSLIHHQNVKTESLDPAHLVKFPRLPAPFCPDKLLLHTDRYIGIAKVQAPVEDTGLGSLTVTRSSTTTESNPHTAFIKFFIGFLSDLTCTSFFFCLSQTRTRLFNVHFGVEPKQRTFLP